jgi:hypothetical protein
MASKKKQAKLFKPFSITVHKVLIAAVVTLFLVTGALSMFVYYMHENMKMASNEHIRLLVRTAIDGLYDIADDEIQKDYNNKSYTWPGYKLRIAMNEEFGKVYIWQNADENNNITDYQVSNNSVKFFSPAGSSSNDLVNCSRLIFVSTGSSEAPQDHVFAFSKTLSDGRTLSFYKNNACPAENVDNFVEYLKQLDSM